MLNKVIIFLIVTVPIFEKHLTVIKLRTRLMFKDALLSR